MIKLGNLEIGEKTHIVGVIPGEKFLKEVTNTTIDILELRIDRFDNLEPNFLIETIKDLRKKTTLPLLATIRRKEETDFKPPKHILSEKERLNLFKQVIPFVDGVDIELQAKEIISPVINFAKGKKKTLIISYHNFKETPGNEKLGIIVKEAKRKGADIVKIATYAKNIDDVARLMCFTYQCSQKPLVSISLGKIGSISRIIGSVFGSCLTYAFLDESKNGQLSIKELVDTINRIYERR
ncbi:MAG TPA: type I 3-dehydroquinate dehydratase [Elusimicrobia bacterium]|jgi:3-dehydroquinate dehydratase-1|nr:type I 3-dehydroquinate dehydratase [Elusimicrobiota bacterium]